MIDDAGASGASFSQASQVLRQPLMCRMISTHAESSSAGNSSNTMCLVFCSFVEFRSEVPCLSYNRIDNLLINNSKSISQLKRHCTEIKKTGLHVWICYGAAAISLLQIHVCRIIFLSSLSMFWLLWYWHCSCAPDCVDGLWNLLPDFFATIGFLIFNFFR